METLDAIVTYTLDLVLGGSAFYLGASLTLYLVERWKKLEPKSKVKAPQAVNIPLQLKASVAEAIPLEMELQEARSLEAMPVMPTMPTMPSAPSMPEDRSFTSTPSATSELQLAEKPEPIDPAAALPELQLRDKSASVESSTPSIETQAPEPASESLVALPELQLSQPIKASEPEASEPEASEPKTSESEIHQPEISEPHAVSQAPLPEPFSQLPEPLYAEDDFETAHAEVMTPENALEDAPKDAAENTLVEQAHSKPVSSTEASTEDDI